MTTLTLDFSKPHVLRDEREYDAAVAELDALLDRGKLSREEADRLEFLTLLVETYDREHHPIADTSTPESVLDFVLEQNGLARADLAPLMGGRSRVSDFFNGHRALSLGQIQKLRERFNLAADVLIPRETGAVSGSQVRVSRIGEAKRYYGKGTRNTPRAEKHPATGPRAKIEGTGISGQSKKRPKQVHTGAGDAKGRGQGTKGAPRQRRPR